MKRTARSAGRHAPKPARERTECKLKVGFLLTPRFTLTAFSGFVDALRLASDDGDFSRQRLCQWDILGNENAAIASSCGVKVLPTAPLEAARRYDYLVVVGGLLHGGQKVPNAIYNALKQGAEHGVRLAGLCTGSFVLARAGLLDGYLACVSWFHRDEFSAEFPGCRIVSNQLFIVDRDRCTCAGGTSVVHLAAHIIEHAVGRAHAVKALRIMIEEQPLPSRTLQPEAVLSDRSSDSVVHKAMLMLEQQLRAPVAIDKLCEPLGIGRRQLERRFRDDIGLGPAEYRLKLRVERASWLLKHTDLGVTEIALECGFSDGSNFSRIIRNKLGVSPRQLRAAPA